MILMKDTFDLHVIDFTDGASHKREMLSSQLRAFNFWPPKFANGYAEAFTPFVGRAQGPCIFTEIPQGPVPGSFRNGESSRLGRCREQLKVDTLLKEVRTCWN